MPSSTLQGLTWYDFLSQFEDRRASSIVSGHRLSQPTSESRRSSGLSSLTVSSGNAPPLPRRPTLLRTQTFDSPQTEPADDTLVVAHSTRSHSCIAPVDVNIRRLSGNVNLAEEPALDADGQVIGQTSDAILSPPIIPDSVCSSARSSFAISRSEQKRREALWDLFQVRPTFAMLTQCSRNNLIWRTHLAERNCIHVRSSDDLKKRFYGAPQENSSRGLCHVRRARGPLRKSRRALLCHIR